MAMPLCRCSLLYQSKKSPQKALASCMDPKLPGKSGQYFKVLNWLSEYGLSLETRGRLCDCDAEVGQQVGDTF